MKFGSQLLFKLLFICIAVLMCAAENTEVKTIDSGEFIGRMIEEGRTMVHHAMKRFMIILPAIFFKAGVAFTMLLLVAIASVNNGFIGFLLLVVGLGSVLARLQDGSRRPTVVPYYLPQPSYHHASYHHDWDRSDKGVEQKPEKAYSQSYPSLNQQYAYTALSSNNPYYGQTKI